MIQNFQCRCGELLELTGLEHPYGSVEWFEQVVSRLEQSGWTTAERLVDKDGRKHVFAYCSVECHNASARLRCDRRSSEHWWRDIKKFGGDMPPCTCSLEPDERGCLVLHRDERCPWCSWQEGWRAKHNDRQRKLLERWRDVKPGALVFEHDSVNKGRGRGRTCGVGRLVEDSFGGFTTALVPVADWGPHPRLEDLTLVDIGDVEQRQDGEDQG